MKPDRNLDERCATCRFWRSAEGARAPVLGECRVSAPTFNPGGYGLAEDDRAAGLPPRPWPITQRTDWCGSWARLARGSEVAVGFVQLKVVH